MRQKKLLVTAVLIILIVSQLLIPAVTGPSPASADAGWTKYASNPVFTRGVISGAPSVIYDSTEDIYKMWYTHGVVNVSTIDAFISDIADLSLGTLINDLSNGNFSAIANNDAANIKAVIDYLASLSTDDLSNLFSGSGSVISYAISDDDGHTWSYQSDALSSTPGDWDSFIVGSPSVVKTSSGYEMWYTGGKIDFAKVKTLLTDLSQLSADNLKTILNDLVDLNISAFFSDLQAAQGNDYLLNVAAHIMDVITSTNLAIGHATFTGSTWTKDSANPVIQKGTGTAWDKYGVATPSVIKNGSTYEMWYAGFKLDFDQLLTLLVASNLDEIETALLAGVNVAIGHATFTGSTWNKDSGNSPVLQKGSASSWDSYGVFAPSVIKNSSGNYEMWYTGVKSVPNTLLNFLKHTVTLNNAVLNGTNMAIGHATYANSTWTKDSNPVLSKGTGDAWDKYGVGFPSVVKVGNASLMWYTGIKTDPRGVVLSLLAGNGLTAAFSGSQIAIGHAYTIPLELTASLSRSKSTYLLGEIVNLSANITFESGTATLGISGPQPQTFTLPVSPGSYNYPAQNLRLEVTYSTTAGYGYAIRWTPPIFKDPAPQYSVIPDKTEAFSVPTLPPPSPPAPGGPSALPDSTLVFSIPSIPAPEAEAGAPPELGQTSVAFDIPTVEVEGAAAGAPLPLPTTTQAFDVPTVSVPSAPSGVETLPASTLAFEIPGGQTPRGITYDGTYFWVIVDGTPKNRILKLNSAGALQAGFDAPSANVQAITYLNGFLWVADNDSRQIIKLDPTTGTVASGFSPFAIPDMQDIGAMEVSGSYLLLGAKNWDRIYKVSQTGTLIETKWVQWPWSGTRGLAIRALDTENWYAANGSKIYKIRRSDGYQASSWTTSPSREDIQGMKFVDDTLYFADAATNAVYKAWAPAGIEVTQDVRGLAYGGTYLWAVVDGSPKDKILKISLTDGSLVTSFDAPDDSIEDIAYVGDYLYVISQPMGQSAQIKKLSPTNGAESAGFPTPGPGWQMGGMGTDGTDLFLSNKTGRDIYKASATTGTLKTQGSDWNSPEAYYTDLAWRASASDIFGAKDNTIMRFSGTSPFAYQTFNGNWITSLDDIVGLAFVSDTLYIADNDTHKIYKASIPTGISITTDPKGLAYDGTYLWILVDGTPNQEILKVNLTDGSLVSHFSAPGTDMEGLAYVGNFLWVLHNTSGGQRTIEKIDPANGSAFGAVTLTYLWNEVGDMAAYGTKLLVSARNDKGLWLRDTAGGDQGDISDWNSPLNGYTGIAYKLDKGIFGAKGNSIIRLSASGGSGSYQQQWTVTPDDIQALTFVGNYLFIADATSRQIYKASVPSGVLHTTDPKGIAYDGTNLWIVVDGSPVDSILKVNPSTGALIAYYDAPTSAIEDITCLGSYLYVISTSQGGQWGWSNQVYKIDPANGAQVTSWDTPNGWGMRGLGNDGSQLLMSDHMGNNIYRQSLTGTHDFTQMSVPGAPFYPFYDLAYRSSNQDIFVAKDSGIARIDATNYQFLEQYNTTRGDIQGLAFAGSVLYIADAANQKVYQATIPPPVVTVTTEPRGLATDGTNLYLVVSGSPRSKVIMTDTSGAVLNSFDAPGVNVDAITYLGGALYVAVNDEMYAAGGPQYKIKKINKDTGQVLDDWSSPNNTQIGALASDGTNLYAGSKWYNDWFVINPTTHSFTQKWLNPMSYPLPYSWSAMAWGSLYGASGAQLFKVKTNGDMENSWYLSSGVDIKGLAFIGVDLYMADSTSQKVFQSTMPGNAPELTNVGNYTATLTAVGGQDTAIATTTFSLTRITEVQVNITSPTAGAAFNTTPVAVTGTVNDPSIKQVFMNVGVPESTLVQDDMEQGQKTWQKSGLWKLADRREIDKATGIVGMGKAHSGNYAWYYGQVPQMNYETPGQPNSGNLMIENVPIGDNSALSFWTWYNTEPGVTSDKKLVQVYGTLSGVTQWWNVSLVVDYVSPGLPPPAGSAPNFFYAQVPMAHFQFGGGGGFGFGPQAVFDEVQVDLSPFSGQTVSIRFRFNTVDEKVNNMEGWYIDDVLVKGAAVLGTALTVSDNMTFTGSALLADGMNSIFVKAVNLYTTPALEDTASVQVSLSTRAPVVDIQPVPGMTKTSAQTITVTYQELNWELFTIELENVLGKRVVSSIKEKPAGNSLQQTVYLSEGDNIITATLTNVFDVSASDTATIKLDTTSPTVQVLDTLYSIGEVSARAGRAGISGDPVIFQANATDTGGSGVSAIALLQTPDTGQPSGLTSQQQSDLNAGMAIEVNGVYYQKIQGVVKRLVWFMTASEVPEAVRDQWQTTGQYILPVNIPAGSPPGAFALPIMIADYAGNTAFGTVTAQISSTLSAYDIYLMPAWNLISLPLIPDSSLYAADNTTTQIRKMTQGIGGLVKVWYYDASQGAWLVYNTDSSVPSNLIELGTGRGYWFYVNPSVFKMSPPLAEGLPQTPAPIKFSYSGVVLEPATVPPSYPLVAGWNLVGLHSEWPRPVTDALASVMEPRLWGSLWQYDNYIRFEKDQPPEIILGGFRGLGTSDSMHPSKGYWIFMKSAGTLAP